MSEGSLPLGDTASVSFQPQAMAVTQLLILPKDQPSRKGFTILGEVINSDH